MLRTLFRCVVLEKRVFVFQPQGTFTRALWLQVWDVALTLFETKFLFHCGMAKCGFGDRTLSGRFLSFELLLCIMLILFLHYSELPMTKLHTSLIGRKSGKKRTVYKEEKENNNNNDILNLSVKLKNPQSSICCVLCISDCNYSRTDPTPIPPLPCSILVFAVDLISSLSREKMPYSFGIV